MPARTLAACATHSRPEEMLSVPTRAVHPWVAAGADDVRFALEIGVNPDHRLMRDEVRRIESLGFDAVFLPDHPMLMSDPWLTLAGLVDATTTLRLGVLVSCAAYRHPAMLARAAADVDRMSGGRVILGLGSGDMPHEFAMMGLDYGTPATRRARLEQTLRVVPQLLRGEAVTDEADGVALRGAVLPMAAVQQPHVPILLAGGSRGTLRLAAEHADAVNLGAVAWAGGAHSADDISTRLTTLDGFCSESARAPDSVLRTGLVGVSIAPTADEARGWLGGIPEEMRAFFGGLFFAGTPDDVATHLGKLISAGYRYLVFIPIDTFAGSHTMTELLVSDVLPQVRRRHPA